MNGGTLGEQVKCIEPLFTHTLPKARQRGTVEGKLVLEKLIAAEILEIGVLHPDFAKSLVREVLAVFQDVESRQPRGQGCAARTIRTRRAKCLFDKGPIDPLSQLN
jgi:hypothetical protein